MRVSLRTSITILFALLATGGALFAQAPVSITIERDGRPVGGAEVRVLVEGEMWEVGVTGRDGRVVAPGDLVGLVEGDLVAVRRIDCETTTTVLLIPPQSLGTTGCPETCRCASLGAFLWGEDLRIDLAGQGVAAAPGAERLPPPEPRAERPPPERSPEPVDGDPRWIVGAGGAYAAWPNLDLGCEATGLPLARCDLQSDGPMARASVEFRPWADRPFGLSIDGGFAPGLEVDQRFQDGSGLTRNVVETDVWTVGGFGIGRMRVGERLEAFLGAGVVWTYASAEVTTTFPGGLTVADERQESGPRAGGRAGLEWWSTGRGWGARLQAGGLVGEENDTLSGWHVGALLLLPLGAR